MGANDGSENEKPAHTVNIKAFKMMEHEVTVGLFTLFASETNFKGDKCLWWVYKYKWTNEGNKNWQSPGFTQKDNSPVTCVSWHDITNDFIPWLNFKTGQIFRLPTEAEWEYAARAGSTTLHSWGNSIDCSKADYAKKSCNAEGTSPVKLYSPNQWGLYDMHGNVGECVQDCWHENYNNAPSNGEAWMNENNGNCEGAVFRGGSWGYLPNNLRSAARLAGIRARRYSILGFRLVQGI